MPKGSPANHPDAGNQLVAIVALVVVAASTAWASAWVCDYVLATFENTNALALIITDAGLKSDDATLERKLSTATVALQTVRDFSLALGIGCLGVGAAVAVRAFRGREG